MRLENDFIPPGIRRRLPGRVPTECIRAVNIPRHSAALVERLESVGDLCSSVADVLDRLGRGAVIPRSRLMPLDPRRAVVGPAITLRYLPVDGDASSNRDRGTGQVLGDRDLYGLAEPRDIAVIDASAVGPYAVVGGISAAWGKKAELSACITDGYIRDSASIAMEKLPIWSGGHSPRAGRYRVEAVEINDAVSLAGETVRPGDYIAADVDGVCIIPSDLFPYVVDACINNEAAEAQLFGTIRSADSLEELVARSTNSTSV